MRHAVALGLVALTLVSCGSGDDQQSPGGDDQQSPGGGSLVIDEIAADEACTAEGTLEMGPNGSSRATKGTEFQLQNGLPSIWCEGIVHRWVKGGGELPVPTDEGKATYVIDSDADDPLEFVVTEDGYTYQSGSGSVTMPDGDVVDLP